VISTFEEVGLCWRCRQTFVPRWTAGSPRAVSVTRYSAAEFRLQTTGRTGDCRSSRDLGTRDITISLSSPHDFKIDTYQGRPVEKLIIPWVGFTIKI